MTRSNWKGPSFDKNSLKNFQNLEINYTKIKIARNSVILPKFLKKTFEVHNGKQLNEILVNEEMIGYKFGEFVPTRKRFSFKKKKNQK
jgi:ribosomal protein S19